MSRPTRIGALVAATCVVLVGCADTVNPNRGGLRLGLDDGPLRPPAAIEGDVFEFPRGAWEDGIGGTTVLKIMIDGRKVRFQGHGGVQFDRVRIITTLDGHGKCLGKLSILWNPSTDR